MHFPGHVPAYFQFYQMFIFSIGGF
ncbi:protein of unknown function (plasmid) [Cupriavidus neocaledonicus]|uniref:Uncharacterized protein n=1 Tax=Cupriavidus neocaledonicus TaxID=1040979 RepID=A0A375HS03_9BURK|nr:protein of unknown function [Cupriavidus neocaledonicus]